MNSINGGRQRLKNVDNNDAIFTRYYNGMEMTHTTTWTFDFVKPVVYCPTGIDQCRTEMLYVGNDVTQEVRIGISVRYLNLCVLLLMQ